LCNVNLHILLCNLRLPQLAAVPPSAINPSATTVA